MDVLEYAILLESDALHYYTRSAQHLNNKAAQRVLLYLAKAKKQHKEIINQLKKGLDVIFDSNIATGINNVFEELISNSESFFDTNGKGNQIFQKVIEFERNGAQLFHSFARLTVVENEKGIWRRLEQIDRKHEKMLRLALLSEK